MAALAHRLPVVTYGADDNLPECFRHGDNMMIAAQDDEEGFIRYAQELAADAGSSRSNGWKRRATFCAVQLDEHCRTSAAIAVAINALWLQSG